MTTYQSNPSSPASLSMDSFEEADSTNYVEVIETVIASLAREKSAMVSHPGEGYLWKFSYGTVEVFVQLTGMTDEDTFTVWSPVLKLPAKNEATLMHKLLEMNWGETFEARFGLFNNQVVVLTSRSLTGLCAAEISQGITVVASIADEQDGALQSEFGAE